MVKTQKLSLHTRGNADCQDITGPLAKAVSDSGLGSGTLTVFCPSATSALTTIEYEAGAIADLQRLLDEIIPPGRDYAHNARWGDGNGHSHVRAALLGPSLTIPFVAHELTLGTWQQVIHVDFDVRARRRELILQLVGD
jgi:secondary thiamine-phosphate synthase enzyme